MNSPNAGKRSGRLFGGIFSSSNNKRSPSLDEENEKERGREREKVERGSGSESGKEGGSGGLGSSYSSSPKRTGEKSIKEKEGKEEKRSKSAWTFSVPLRARKLGLGGKKTDPSSAEIEAEKSNSTHEPFSSSLDFLNLGFQELVKCRQVRTYVRAFFCFLSL